MAVQRPFRMDFFRKNSYPTGKSEGGYDVVVFAHTDAVALGAVLAPIPEVRGYARHPDAELADATGLTGEALARAQ